MLIYNTTLRTVRISILVKALIHLRSARWKSYYVDNLYVSRQVGVWCNISMRILYNIDLGEQR